MKRTFSILTLLSLAALLLWPQTIVVVKKKAGAPSPGGWTYIAAATAWDDGAGGTTLDSSPSLNVATGDLLVAFATWEGDTTTAAVADTSSGNSMTMETVSGVGGTAWQQAGYKINATANATSTFRMTLSASRSYREFNVLQFRPNSGNTVTYDAGPAANTGSTNPATSAAISTSGTAVVAIAGAKWYDFVTLTDPLIATVAADGSQDNYVTGTWYKILSSTISDQIAQATGPNTTNWVCHLLAFKAVE